MITAGEENFRARLMSPAEGETRDNESRARLFDSLEQPPSISLRHRREIEGRCGLRLSSAQPATTDQWRPFQRPWVVGWARSNQRRRWFK